MGFYCLVMMQIALELAKTDPAYEDMAIKFYEHFLWIALAIGGATRDGVGLWDAADGFYYDVLKRFPATDQSLCECDRWSDLCP